MIRTGGDQSEPAYRKKRLEKATTRPFNILRAELKQGDTVFFLRRFLAEGGREKIALARQSRSRREKGKKGSFAPARGDWRAGYEGGKKERVNSGKTHYCSPTGKGVSRKKLRLQGRKGFRLGWEGAKKAHFFPWTQKFNSDGVTGRTWPPSSYLPKNTKTGRGVSLRSS